MVRVVRGWQRGRGSSDGRGRTHEGRDGSKGGVVGMVVRQKW